MKKPPLQKTTQTDFIKTALRLPPELHSALVADSERNLRSLNAEILFRLQQNPLAEIKQQNTEALSLLRQLLDRT